MELAADTTAHMSSPLRRLGGRVWTLLRTIARSRRGSSRSPCSSSSPSSARSSGRRTRHARHRRDAASRPPSPTRWARTTSAATSSRASTPGARISLAVGGVVVVVGALVGGLIGIVAGASGGWIDATLMRIMDAILAFPPLILAMAVTLGLGAGLDAAALGITLTSLPYYARLHTKRGAADPFAALYRSRARDRRDGAAGSWRSTSSRTSARRC